jgi:hypothetical protein
MFTCVLYVSLYFRFVEMFGGTAVAATPDPSA